MAGFKQSDLARTAQGAALIASIGNAGKLKIYDGAVPASVAAAETGVLLSTHTCGSPFAPGPSAGVISPTIPSNVNAAATGTATHYRVTTSADVVVYQDDVVASGNGLVLNPSNALLTSGQAVQVNSWTIVMGGA